MSLYSDSPRWIMAFLQKCWYKWWPRKCLCLDVANLIILIFKNGEKNLWKLQFNFHVFFPLPENKFAKLPNFAIKKEKTLILTSFSHFQSET